MHSPTVSYAPRTDATQEAELNVLASVYTAGCSETDLPTGRRNFGLSDGPPMETTNMHHAMWVMSTETCCIASHLSVEVDTRCCGAA